MQVESPPPGPPVSSTPAVVFHWPVRPSSSSPKSATAVPQYPDVSPLHREPKTRNDDPLSSEVLSYPDICPRNTRLVSFNFLNCRPVNNRERLLLCAQLRWRGAESSSPLPRAHAGSGMTIRMPWKTGNGETVPSALGGQGLKQPLVDTGPRCPEQLPPQVPTRPGGAEGVFLKILHIFSCL